MTAPEEPVGDPIVIDLGSASKKSIRKLKDGRGKLMVKVERAVDHVAAELRAEGTAKAVVAVVCVYRRKQRRKRRFLPCPLPFSF